MPVITEDFIKNMNKKFKKTSYRPWDAQPGLSSHSGSINDVLEKDEENNYINSDNLGKTSIALDVEGFSPRLSKGHITSDLENVDDGEMVEDISKILNKENYDPGIFFDKNSLPNTSYNTLFAINSLFGAQKEIMKNILNYIDNNFSNDEFVQTLPIFIENFAEKTGLNVGTLKTSLFRLRGKGLIISRFHKRGRGGFTIFFIKKNIFDKMIDFFKN